MSRDAGETWSLVEGLWNHPQRPQWQPGGGGLCLHTILLDPERLERMRIAISTAGMYVTDDGGATWRPSNQGVRAEFLPDKHPEFGQCVHKVAQATTRPERMFLQNHWGLYRSDDRGESWTDIANGVPSDFGFAMAHPSARSRHAPGSCRSSRTGSAARPKASCASTARATPARSWEPMTNGLPQEDAYETVLRDALAVDALDPAGVYFGTRSGKLFGSARRRGELGGAGRRAAAGRRGEGGASCPDGRVALRDPGPAARARRRPRRGPRRRPRRDSVRDALVAPLARVSRRSATAS